MSPNFKLRTFNAGNTDIYFVWCMETPNSGLIVSLAIFIRHWRVLCDIENTQVNVQDTVMALFGSRSKICLLLSMTLVIIFMLFVYEGKLQVHEKTKSWSNAVHHYITIPTALKKTENCIEEKGTPYLIPKDVKLRNMSEQDLTNIYWKYINTIQTLCRNQTRVGSLNDGGKEVCIDNKYKPSSPCLVYSFGSNYQFDFESDIKRMFNCEIHTFDPSMVITRQRPIPTDITTFHAYGLDGRDFKNNKNWEMRNLSSIRRELKHGERVIDILKVDVEGGEWRAFPEIFKSGVLKYVKQICLEVHYGRTKTGTFWGEVGFLDQLGVLRELYENGFSIFMRERNLGAIQGKIVTVNEISLINKNWKDSN